MTGRERFQLWGVITPGTLRVFLVDAVQSYQQMDAGPLAQAGRWMHVAVVMGPGGFRLLQQNGVLVSSNAYTGCFGSMPNSESASCSAGRW